MADELELACELKLATSELLFDASELLEGTTETLDNELEALELADALNPTETEETLLTNDTLELETGDALDMEASDGLSESATQADSSAIEKTQLRSWSPLE